MRIIAKKTLLGFGKVHANCKAPLERWYQAAAAAQWRNLNDVRKTFPNADVVGNKTVFNIKGNTYRLITVIKYETNTIFISEFLTHAEYDKGSWKTR